MRHGERPPATTARLLVRWLPAAVSGIRLAKLRAAIQAGVAGLRASHFARTASIEVLKAALPAYMNALVHSERLRCLAETTADHDGASSNADAGAWEPGDHVRPRTAGFHQDERWRGQPCVWSEPAGMVHLPLDRTRRRRAVADEDPRALELLRQWNELDSELYTYGADLVTKRVQRLASATPDVASAPRALALPDARYFTFDQPIHGVGWHVREKHPDGWICWMGRERSAWIDLGLQDPVPSYFYCRVPHAISQAAIDSVRVLVNDRPIAVHSRRDGTTVVLAGAVPPELLYGFSDRVRITFTVCDTQRPCDIDPRSPDDRFLGIALNTISLLPIDACPAIDMGGPGPRPTVPLVFPIPRA